MFQILKMSNIVFAVMRWLNDRNRLSVHNLNHVIEPKRPYHDYKASECGVALFPGYPGKWTFWILAIGDMLIQQSQKELATSLLKRPRESSESAIHGINELKDEIRRLKKRVRDLEKVNEMPPSSVNPPSSFSPPSTFSPPSSCNPPSTFSPPSSLSPPSSPPPSFRLPPNFRPPTSSPPQLTALESANVGVQIYNGKTRQALVDSLCHVDALFNCCHVLLTSLFTRDYIVTHSVTGQKGNNAFQPKPKFDQRLYNAMVNILKEKFPGLKDTEITAKVHAVQKKNKTAIQMANGLSSRR